MPLKKRLNTPYKRMAFIVSCLLFIVFIISLIIKVKSSYYNTLDKVLLSSIFLDTATNRFSFAVFISFYLFIVGIVITFFYDSLILKLINWVKMDEKKPVNNRDLCCQNSSAKKMLKEINEKLCKVISKIALTIWNVLLIFLIIAIVFSVAAYLR